MLKEKVSHINLISSMFYTQQINYKIILSKNFVVFISLFDAIGFYIRINNITVKRANTIPNYIIQYRDSVYSDTIVLKYHRFDGFFNRLLKIFNKNKT